MPAGSSAQKFSDRDRAVLTLLRPHGAKLGRTFLRMSVWWAHGVVWT